MGLVLGLRRRMELEEEKGEILRNLEPIFYGVILLLFLCSCSSVRERERLGGYVFFSIVGFVVVIVNLEFSSGVGGWHFCSFV